MGIREIRRANFQLLFERFKQSVWDSSPDQSERGMLRMFANRCGYDSAAFFSHINTDIKPMGSRAARKMEEALSLPNGWMDAAHDENGPVSPAEEMFTKAALEFFRKHPQEAQQALLAAISEKFASSKN